MNIYGVPPWPTLPLDIYCLGSAFRFCKLTKEHVQGPLQKSSTFSLLKPARGIAGHNQDWCANSVGGSTTCSVPGTCAHAFYHYPATAENRTELSMWPLVVWVQVHNLQQEGTGEVLSCPMLLVSTSLGENKTPACTCQISGPCAPGHCCLTWCLWGCPCGPSRLAEPRSFRAPSGTQSMVTSVPSLAPVQCGIPILWKTPSISDVSLVGLARELVKITHYSQALLRALTKAGLTKCQLRALQSLWQQSVKVDPLKAETRMVPESLEHIW